MKKGEVPQDDEGLLEGKLREVCYAVDENGNYVTVLSSGWTPKNAALKQAWEEVDEKVEEVRKKVLEGKLSPVAYYMEKNIMDLKLLSQYTRIPKWRIRRHLVPKIFNKLGEEELAKYAKAFETSVSSLKNFSESSNLKDQSK
jgi:hypothetical protein